MVGFGIFSVGAKKGTTPAPRDVQDLPQKDDDFYDLGSGAHTLPEKTPQDGVKETEMETDDWVVVGEKSIVPSDDTVIVDDNTRSASDIASTESSFLSEISGDSNDARQRNRQSISLAGTSTEVDLEAAQPQARAQNEDRPTLPQLQLRLNEICGSHAPQLPSLPSTPSSISSSGREASTEPESDPLSLRCGHCSNSILKTSDIVSSKYTAISGPGYLASAARNVRLSEDAQEVVFTSGKYTIKNVYCKTCDTCLGTTYVGVGTPRNEALRSDNLQKIGKFLLGQQLLKSGKS